MTYDPFRSPAPWRHQFDHARDPYAARNSLGAVDAKYVADAIAAGGGGGGGGAPTSAEYITAAADPTLTNERVLTNTATVTWDFATPGQAKANAATGGGGNVSNSGTPTVGQYAKWVTATTIQGVAPATVLSDIGAQPAGSYQPLDADLTAIAALTGTDVIYYRSAANTWAAVTIGANLTFSGGTLAATGGGGGTPGGSTTQVQYNNAGAFGGAANLTWNNGTSVLTLTGQLAINVGSATSIIAGGVVQAASFKCTGTLAVLGPELTPGNVALRPSGVASATGQLLVGTTGVTATTPVTLPADPTANLHAATKQYVDARTTATYPPQGRLTLQTLTPVMTTTQSAKTTLFYTPYVGNKVPIYDGTTMAMMTFAELSNVTTASSVGNAGPAAVAASSVYDLFVWSNAGTVTLTRGPVWTNDTTRSAGTALVMVNGILLNNAAITNGPAASRGTYVGTTRSNASSQLDWIFGGDGLGGQTGFFGVWNCYNRVPVGTNVRDTTTGWSYAVALYRAANNSNNNRVSFVVGLVEDSIAAQFGGMTVSTGSGTIGIGVDTTTAPSGAIAFSAQQNSIDVGWMGPISAPGFHFIQAIEYTAASVAWFGKLDARTHPALSVQLMM